MPGDDNERQLKHDRLVRFMTEHQLDLVVLTKRPNFAWYTGGRLNHVPMNTDMGAVSLVITPEQAVCLANSIEAPRQITEELGELDISVESFAWHESNGIESRWRELLANRRAACDGSAWGLTDDVAMLPGAFARLRWTLTPSEIARYRALGCDVAESIESACHQVEPGMTEHKVAAVIAEQLMQRAIRPSVILVAADERVRRFRHPIPTETKFERFGMAVCGGERDGLVISNSRLFSFGAIDDDLRRRHEAVCTVDTAMIEATRPGNTLGDVMRVAMQTYADFDFADEWQFHHQGGSTGYLGREVKATPNEPTPIFENQAFAWNPTIAGTKSEDTILVGPETNEILSNTGHWPRTAYQAGGRHWDRCDVLNLKEV